MPRTDNREDSMTGRARDLEASQRRVMPGGHCSGSQVREGRLQAGRQAGAEQRRRRKHFGLAAEKHHVWHVRGERGWGAGVAEDGQEVGQAHPKGYRAQILPCRWLASLPGLFGREPHSLKTLGGRGSPGPGVPK